MLAELFRIQTWQAMQWPLVGQKCKTGKGQLKINIDSEFGLDQVADTHERSESGRAQGNIVINVSA
jgi:NADPH:quinone reductase-like Zn-dependent oxidoreductase